MIRLPLAKSLQPYARVALIGSSILLAAATAAAAQDKPSEAALSDAAASAASRGAMLAISPLRVELDGAGAAQTLRLANTGGAPVTVQTRVFAWTQDAVGDLYAPSNAVIASPAVATIPPGQTQIIRLFRTSSVGNEEKAYRISIDQIPDAKSPEASAAKTRLRFLVPMFVDRTRTTPSDLAWQQSDTGLAVKNRGGRTARIAWIKLLDPAGRVVAVKNNTLRYVQTSSSAAWPTADLCRQNVTHVLANIDETQVDVPLAPCS